MKKKKFLIATQIIISLFVVTSLVYGGERFNAIADLKDQMRYPPEIYLKSDGGYFAIWTEVETKGDPSYSIYRYYYRLVDADMKIVISKKEFDFWRHGDYTEYGFSNKSAVWLDSNKLLFFGWKMVSMTSDPVGYRPEWIILSSSGEILAGPDTSIYGGSPDATLVKDSKGNVYAVECDTWSGVKVTQVYPDFTQVKQTSKQNLDDFYKNFTKYTEFKLRDAVVATISKDRLLICNRMGWGDILKEKRGAWHSFRPDRVYYALAYLDGNFISDPLELDLEKYAFRKILGIHLGGIYYASYKIKSIDEVEAAVQDMDLSKLPNGEIILSVTGKDDKGELCVYQIKFSPEGNVVKPAKMDGAKAKPIPKGVVLPIMKTALVQSVGDDLVLFGFDEEGNFYSNREVWRESKE